MTDLVGFPGYTCDELGNVYSTRMGPLRRLKPRRFTNGYLGYDLRRDGGTFVVLAHRVIAEAFLGEIPKGMTVNHLDFDKTNNSITNLEIISKRENYLHALNAGRMPSGDKHPSAKLRDFEVTQIRDLARVGLTQDWIAGQYGVSQSLVHLIIAGRRRKA